MSNQEQQPTPNPWGFLRDRRHDERASIIRDLLTSDKNNPVKARIPTIFGMVMMNELGIWGASPDAKYTIGSDDKTLEGTVESDQEYFYDMYNQISQAYQGLARGEYERAASAWLGQAAALQAGGQQMRVEEGAKKAK